MAEWLREKMVAITGLDNWISGFVALFVVGLFNEHLTALRNLGLYMALLLGIIKLVTQHQAVLSAAKSFIGHNRLPLALLFLFLFSIIYSSLFPYTETTGSISSLFNETRLMAVFFLAIIVVNDKEMLVQAIVYGIVVAMLLGTWHFVVKDMPEWADLDSSFRVSRNYATYYEFLFPFALYQFLVEKRIWLKALIAVVLFFGMLTLVLSGVRGAWLAVSIEFFIILGYVIYYHKEAFRKKMPYLIAGALTVSSLLFFALESSSVVKSAFERGTTSLTARDRIVKERLPLFLDYGDKVFGLGHGGAQYHRFMHDHDAPKSIGRHEGGVFVFNRDEPFLIQLLLHFGFVGLILTITLLGYMVFDLLRINKYANLCGVSILSGLVGVFLVRGLFEGRYLSGLLFIVVLYLIQRSIVNSLSSTKSEMVSSL